MTNVIGYHQYNYEQQQNYIQIIPLVLKLHIQQAAVSPLYLQALRASGLKAQNLILCCNQQSDHMQKRNRCKRKIRSAQFEAGVADQYCQQTGNNGADQHADPRRNLIEIEHKR